MTEATNNLLSGANAEQTFLRTLLERERLSAISAERLTRVQLETEERLCPALLKLGLLSETDLLRELASFSGLAVAEQVSGRLPEEAVLSSAFLVAHEIVPIGVENGVLHVAIWDCLDSYPQRALEFATGFAVEPRLTTRSRLLQAMELLCPAESGPQEDTSAAMQEEELEKLKDLTSEAPVIRLVQRIIALAVESRASDIHWEPVDEAMEIRFRMDGLLREIERVSGDQCAAVVSRIKVIAGLNIAEKRLPQDGRIRVTVHGKDIDFRVATSPTLYGESVVMRILDRQDVALDLDVLGLDAASIRALRAAIARPYGIILVTGPTGSGKTTTLYAALKEIATPEKKILTIEDPVEYTLDGVNQVQVKPQIGLTFAHALRAFLRQDPDVLMVGEIRDKETAQIAVQAALTGHLLLSTLHTNTAAAAIARLLDMGVDDYLLTTTLHVILGQRLVRRLCSACRQPYEPGQDLLVRCGLEKLEPRKWYRAAGCSGCRGTGYRGRVGIVEALEMSDAVRSRVLARQDAHELERVAVAQGMRTMFRHGVDVVESGVTSFEEVIRVTSLN